MEPISYLAYLRDNLSNRTSKPAVDLCLEMTNTEIKSTKPDSQAPWLRSPSRCCEAGDDDTVIWEGYGCGSASLKSCSLARLGSAALDSSAGLDILLTIPYSLNPVRTLTCAAMVRTPVADDGSTDGENQDGLDRSKQQKRTLKWKQIISGNSYVLCTSLHR